MRSYSLNITFSFIRRLVIGILATIIFTTTVMSSIVSANADFYAGNDIFMYDKNAVACTPNTSSNTDPTSVTGADVAEKIFNFLTSTTFKGLEGKAMNAVQAAGVLGNFQHESGMNPAQKQIGGGGGRGLAQWDDRSAALFAFAQSKGKPWEDLDVQLQFMKKELDEWEGKNLVDKGFMKVSTPEDAAVVFEKAYERAGVKAYEERKKYAVEYYGRFASTVGDGKTFDAFIGGCRYSGFGSVGDFMDNDAFVSYAQCASSTGGGPWGNMTNNRGQKMCEVGCGPTSLAMVVRNMTGSTITPADTLAHYNEHQYWSSYGSGPQAMRDAAESWGLRAEPFDPRDLNAYKQVFASGGLIVVGGQGAEPFYTGFGHYIVVRGITEDGKFRVSDPGRGYVKDYDISTIMAGTKNRANNATAFFKS